MVLFNVTFDTTDCSGILVPSVPHTASGIDGEDCTTPRVCLADSIEHCLQAVAPATRSALYVGSVICVRVISIDESELITPQQLVQEGKVPDALENGEYWCLHEVECKTSLFKVTDFKYSFELAWTCIHKHDVVDVIHKLSPEYCPQHRAHAAEGVYRDYFKYCNDNHLYSLVDDVWYEIAALPWARKVAFTDLCLQPVNKPEVLSAF